MNRIFPTITAIALAAALALPGCGGSDSSSSSGGAYGGSPTEQSSSALPAAGHVTVISAASVPRLGKVLVDARGFTVYDFHKDRGKESTCYGACAKVWRPVIAHELLKTSNGALASYLGKTERKYGSLQLTYAGHPLYTYTADSKPGEANGNDFSSYGAQWYALKPNGEEAGD